MPSQTDEARWFSEEVQPHDAQLKAYLRSSFPAVRDVDDVVQESYLRLWKVRASTQIRSARALLFTVARRLALDVTRRVKHSPIEQVDQSAELSVTDEAARIREHVEARERLALLGEAIGRLPRRCREVFVLHKVQGLSRRETAERLGLSEKTVETQVMRAMERCGAYLRRRTDGMSFHDAQT